MSDPLNPERGVSRGLLSTMLLITAAALLLATVAPGYGVCVAGLAVVGLTSVVAQLIVPMSSSLAAESDRGTVVGTVMSGLLIGVLLARTVSVLLAAALGWRSVFAFAAVVMVLLALTLRRAPPRVPPTTDLAYRELLRSVFALVASQPVLRQRMVLGALSFGCFSVLWTSLAFLLAGPPFHYGNAVIGLFGLAGVAGAAAAYMVSYFIGAAVLSAVTSSLYASDGWSGVCVLGAATAALTLAVWVITAIAMRYRGQPARLAAAADCPGD